MTMQSVIEFYLDDHILARVHSSMVPHIQGRTRVRLARM